MAARSKTQAIGSNPRVSIAARKPSQSGQHRDRTQILPRTQSDEISAE